MNLTSIHLKSAEKIFTSSARAVSFFLAYCTAGYWVLFAFNEQMLVQTVLLSQQHTEPLKKTVCTEFNKDTDVHLRQDESGSIPNH